MIEAGNGRRRRVVAISIACALLGLAGADARGAAGVTPSRVSAGTPTARTPEAGSAIVSARKPLPRSVRRELRSGLLRRLRPKKARKSCRSTSGFEHQMNITRLLDPSLRLRYLCVFHVRPKELLPDVVDRLAPTPTGLTAIIAFTEAPADLERISYQLGLGLDRPGVENRSVATSGEGLVRVPNDLFFFGMAPADWTPVAPLDSGFMPTVVPARVWGFLQPGRSMHGLLVEDGLLTPDTLAHLQLFGRATPAGQMPTAQDPAASALAPIGPIGGCIERTGSFDPCNGDVSAGRFEARVSDPALHGEETAPGEFWFAGPDGSVATVKIFDACATDRRIWAFAVALTASEVEITVTEVRRGAEEVLRVGGAAPLIFDEEALSTCPR